MQPKHFERFVKLMGMTGSQSDGEAINALRMATAILIRENITWEEFLTKGIKIQHESWSGSKPVRKAAVSNEQAAPIFQFLLSTLRDGSFRNTIISIYLQWKDKGWVSERQWEVVFNSYKQSRR
jgi:hypothetical protein